jgi:very-short-patch-repair endonuclease
MKVTKDNYKQVFRDKYTLKQNRNFIFRKQLTEKATSQELIFKEYLEQKNIYFKFQKGFLKPFHRIVDFYLPKLRMIVEIDGGYHKGIIMKDEYKDKIWSRFRTLRILNEDVDNGNYISIFEEFIK